MTRWIHSRSRTQVIRLGVSTNPGERPARDFDWTVSCWWWVLNGLGKVRRVPVIAAYILIQTRVGGAAAVTAALQDLPGVSEPACLTGPYDVIARAQAPNLDELAKFVIAQVHSLAGVERTVTCPVVHL
jgi:DNA-binding Lrp family transcriptional regulator